MAATRLAALAAALATLGAAAPLVMMVNGSVALGIDYHWWTWPAIPAAWTPAVLGAWLTARRPAAGAALLCLGAAAGLGLFRHEASVLTFGPAWLLGAYLYLDALYLDAGRRYRRGAAHGSTAPHSTEADIAG